MDQTMGDQLMHHFDWTEYLVFFVMLGLSLAIGLYFGCYKSQKTVSDYLLGSKNMSVFPIAMSLVSSYTSGITLLGLPTEIYTFGTQYSMGLICNLLVCIITVTVFLPVFYKLQLLSLYEYLELRFNRSVRMVASFLYAVALLLYIPIVIYGPALAFNQVSGMNIHVVTPLLCIVCIFYTTLGGLKAVVWTDALQGSLMMIAVFAVVVLGVLKAGGVAAIFEAASEGGRLELFNMNPDPTERLNFWSASIGFLFTYTAYTSVSPACIQRLIALPSYKQAQMAVLLLAIGINLFAGPSIFIGLIMYAVYRDCDPLTSKAISRPDQILPYFVLDVAGHIRGLPGLFVVGICCAALSTMSTGLNTLAGTIFEDFVEPCLKGKVSDERANRILKVLVVITGAICVTLVTLVEKLGRIIELSSSFGGMTTGSTLGIFALGMLFPMANATGALVGGLVSMTLMAWLMVGMQFSQVKGLIQHPTKPISVLGCNFTIPGNITIPLDRSDEVWAPYRLSMFYYSFVGCMVVIVVGLIVSYITGPPEEVNPDLLSPVIKRFLPKKKYQQVPLKQTSGPKEEAAAC